MKVKSVMIRTPAHCELDTNLGAAVEAMWNFNCGMLPVVDGTGKVVGVITDRDVCIALGTGNHLPGEMAVGDILSRRVVSCRSEDNLHDVLTKMGEARVRRLPVIGHDGGLEGILSIDDIVLRMEAGKSGGAEGISSAEVLAALKRIYEPQLPERVQRRAAGA